MCFTWPDPISFAADIVTIVGVPVLAVSTWKLYQEAEEARKPKGVSEDCLTFYDVHEKCAVNLVPFKNITTIPRKGDFVMLPGETDEKPKNYGGGRYEVTSVDFYYREDRESNRPCPAAPLVIQVNVKRIIDYSR